MSVQTVGIDHAKNIFHVHGVDEHGQAVLRRSIKRKDWANFFATLPVCLIGMEACSSAHYWGALFVSQGHRVRVMSPQFVKPYVKTNKSDRNDAEAICEAVTRPSMRFVPLKSTEQLDILAVHRVRQRLVGEKVALSNQIRGLLAERGIVLARRIAAVHRGLPALLDESSNTLSGGFRELLAERNTELRELESKIAHYDLLIRSVCQREEPCQRLGAIEGIGPLTATALYAAAGDARVFKNGRHFAAWLGLVPRQHSSGGKPRLLGISKRGDTYLRTLLIHGARAVLWRAGNKTDPRSQWLCALRARRHTNVTCVALANKNARIAWRLLAYSETYRHSTGAPAAT